MDIINFIPFSSWKNKRISDNISKNIKNIIQVMHNVRNDLQGDFFITISYRIPTFEKGTQQYIRHYNV